MVTVFTPTYNRAYTLPKLFDCLCKQTSKDFEWIIVDDGSTDDTEDLIKKYITNNKDKEVDSNLGLSTSDHRTSIASFPIRYYKQENGGKHRAINRGVREASGELFFIVDSDDRLTEDAVEWITCAYEQIKGDKRFAGLSGIRIYPDGTRIGGGEDWGVVDASNLERVMKYHIAGDMAEIYLTSVLREYPFPEIEGETFCPEAMVWNRIAQQYVLRFFHRPIYVCEYLADGLTAKIVRIRHRSPKTSMLYYSELYQMNIPLKEKLKANINFWRFAPVPLWHHAKRLGMLTGLSFVGLPFGCVYSCCDQIMNGR